MTQPDQSVLGLVPARGGSKSVPGKNIAPVAGRPLIAWTIAAALECGRLERVIVDSDDANIAEVARQWGAQTPYLRPASLAGDHTPSMDVILHALDWLVVHEAYRPAWVCLLQPTSPLRSAVDIAGALQLALDRHADAVVSITATHHHPLWQKRIGPDGRLHDAFAAENRPARRQDLEPTYALNGAIYLARTSVLRDHRTWYTSRTYGFVMPEDRSLDVDSSWDLHLADLVLSERGRDENHSHR